MILYNLSIQILRFLYWLTAFFHAKARLFVDGRKGVLEKLKISLSTNTNPLIWVHCASLGEFEQGRPIMEAFKRKYQTHKILLTFFSPSGYEVRKNYSGADYIFYLPWDTASNARKFIQVCKPVLAIFIKYEFWFHYSDQLKRSSIPLISASCIFRSDQIFFQWYGSLSRKTLRSFNYFFTQNRESIDLLNQLAITTASVAGDTRFDRVYTITQDQEPIDIVQRFKHNEKVFVVGSMWPEDFEVLTPFVNEHTNTLKFIIAPHEITETFLTEIEASIDAKCVRYSQAHHNPDAYSVLIIDNVGMLSRLYRYGEFAFVGGGYGKGLHNILEAASYGVPIFFGNKNYEKFQEARELIMRGGAFAISDYADLKAQYELMVNHPETFLLACEVTKSYVKENLGATDKIMSYCAKFLQT